MVELDPSSEKTLQMAVRITDILDELGVASALIGAAQTFVARLPPTVRRRPPFEPRCR